MEVGKVGYIAGPMLASATGWRATVKGKQAHGARPDESVDPIVMASQVVLALQTIRSRNLSPFAPTVVTVGIMRGGERSNIIPAEVKLEGTVRTFDESVTDVIERRMREIFDGVTKSAGGSYEIQFERGYPVTSNDSALAARMRPTMERVMGSGNVVNIKPTTGAEDFGLFAMQTPGFFYRLGTVKPGTTTGGHHTPNFMADDASIPIGMRVMTAMVLDYLNYR
jgi:amidohydrolase